MTLPHTTDIFKYPARFQFGQSGPCGGSSCCTDTCIQMIVEYYREKTKGLWTIRKAAQAKTSYNEASCTGINYVEVLNALKYFGVDYYRLGGGATASNVLSWVKTGPVIVGVHYGSYPNNHNGKCGWSNRAEVSGRTDCGFRGAHAVLVIGSRQHTVNGTRHTDFYVRDPDHNSPARPEKPAYDIITYSQLNRAMANLPRYTAFTYTYAIYPTKRKVIATSTVTRKSYVKTCTTITDLNVRLSPTTSGTYVKTLPKGYKFTSTRIETAGGAYRGPDGKTRYDWLEFNYSGRLVWVARGYVKEG